MTEKTIDQQLQEMASVAYAHAPAVRARFDAAGLEPKDIRTVADLDKLPILAKDEIVALQREDPPFGGLLAIPMAEVPRIYLSPGPIYEPEMKGERSAVEMAMLSFQYTGFGPGDVVLNTLSYHLVPAGLLVDNALVGLGCTAVPGGVGNSDLQLQMMLDLGVTGYAGTPSFLMSLLQKAEEKGLDFHATFKLKKALFTAEPLPPSLRQTFVDHYGLTVGNVYATADVGFIALNLDGSLPMTLLPRPVVQVVEPDTGRSVGPGEVGEVVVTNLSLVYPLIRFGTGDMAVNLDPQPGQSRQEERALILVGRSGEAVKVRGMFVHPNQLRHAVGQVLPAQAVQGVVTRPETRDHFVVRIVPSAGEPPAPETIDALKEGIRSACRVRVDEIHFVAAEEIPSGAPGMDDQRDWS